MPREWHGALSWAEAGAPRTGCCPWIVESSRRASRSAPCSPRSRHGRRRSAGTCGSAFWRCVRRRRAVSTFRRCCRASKNSDMSKGAPRRRLSRCRRSRGSPAATCRRVGAPSGRCDPDHRSGAPGGSAPGEVRPGAQSEDGRRHRPDSAACPDGARGRSHPLSNHSRRDRGASATRAIAKTRSWAVTSPSSLDRKTALRRAGARIGDRRRGPAPRGGRLARAPGRHPLRSASRPRCRRSPRRRAASECRGARRRQWRRLIAGSLKPSIRDPSSTPAIVAISVNAFSAAAVCALGAMSSTQTVPMPTPSCRIGAPA